MFSFSLRAANIKALLVDTIRKKKKAQHKTNSRTSLLFRNVAQPSETDRASLKKASPQGTRKPPSMIGKEH